MSDEEGVRAAPQDVGPSSTRRPRGLALLAVDPEGIGSAARSGARWGMATSVLQQVLSAVVTVVLARALAPADFGLVAAAILSTTFFMTIAGFGIAPAMVKRRELTVLVASTSMWMVTIQGFVVTVLGVVTAPLVARLLGQPDATPFIAAFSLQSILTLVAGGHRALLQRGLQFRQLYLADVVWSVSYAVLSLVLALTTDLGAWSMVLGALAGEFVRLVVLVGYTRFWPRREFEPSVLRSDLRFNTGFLGINVASYTAKNADNVAVSSLLGGSALGAYYVAYVLPNIIRQRFTVVAGEVLYPILTRSANNLAELRDRTLGVIDLLVFLTAPILVGIAITAAPLVDVLFGSAWSAAAQPLAVLSIAATFEVVNSVGIPILLARGRAGLAARISFLRLGVLLVGLAVVWFHPTMFAVVIAVLVSTVVTTLFTERYAFRDVGIGGRDLVARLAPTVVSLLVMAAAVGAAASFTEMPSELVELVMRVFVGAGAYLASMLVIDRRRLRVNVKQSMKLLGRG